MILAAALRLFGIFIPIAALLDGRAAQTYHYDL